MIYVVEIERILTAEVYIEAANQEEAEKAMRRINPDYDCDLEEVETNMKLGFDYEEAEDIPVRPLPEIIKAKDLL